MGSFLVSHIIIEDIGTQSVTAWCNFVVKRCGKEIVRVLQEAISARLLVYFRKKGIDDGKALSDFSRYFWIELPMRKQKAISLPCLSGINSKKKRSRSKADNIHSGEIVQAGSTVDKNNVRGFLFLKGFDKASHATRKALNASSISGYIRINP